MSLDFSLYAHDTKQCECGKEIEINAREVLDLNITHNLNKMAKEAGIYMALWRPEELFGVESAEQVRAKQITPILEEGLAKLKADPEHFKQFNASNGWGMYEHFVPFVEEVLEGCKDYPEATLYVSR